MDKDIDRIAALAELAEEVKKCQKCEISKYRTNAVFGEGNPYSKIMLIGEAPGKTEDETGRPFVGNAGKFLDSMLNAAGYSREDVYITNVIKTRPPENRDPQITEIENCNCYLRKQIEIINPQIIVTLGRYSMGLFLPGVTISRVHGTPYLKDNRIYMPMYHPAATLHQPSLKEVAIKDMLKLPKLVELLEKGKVLATSQPNEKPVVTEPVKPEIIQEKAQDNAQVKQEIQKEETKEIDKKDGYQLNLFDF